MLQDAYAVDHREAGYHHHHTVGQRCDKIVHWSHDMDTDNLPDHPQIMDINPKDISKKYGTLQARQLKLKQNKKLLTVRFVFDTADVEILRNSSFLLTDDEIKLTLFLVPSQDLKEHLSDNLNIPSDNVGVHVSSTNVTRDMFVLECLAGLTAMQNKIVTVPLDQPAADFSLPKVSSGYPHKMVTRFLFQIKNR